ncbi:hypothetical protein PLICRDRAFT_45612 [Plicaturopsis crispa FD-325 SS-3]|uniref:BD-FAE-like domain-containing protein n=1 Tax=Plicaturopsis crispa FD-325 SS-3 TaxID=944288 RepID=A0A0C9T993_PLICR|nr:hypothetical protein PLICRDRAFT_45612 [Plicaturopsis crispa FD-325 SS-3]
MDAIANIPTTDVTPELVVPTLKAFAAVLETKRTEIEAVEKKTFQYGDLARQQLDVYYPPSSSGKVPVLFFVYGGGFVSGERAFPGPFSLIYANLGSFYAKRGFLTVIADYRLVPNVGYPTPSEDVRDAALWIVQNAQTVAAAGVQPDVDALFLTSHSAGTVHLVTLLLEAQLRESIAKSLLPRIKGLVLSGGPYTYEPGQGAEFLVKYYGTAEATAKNEALALLKDAPDEYVKALPEVLLVQSERDAGWAKSSGDIFKAALGARLGKEVPRIIGEGHNHISINAALGSGEGEEWAEEAVAWMKARPE